MKSIVLCERTLVQESEDFHSLKEDQINEDGSEKTEEKKILNGISDSKLSGTHLNTSGNDGTFQNGNKRFSKESLEEEVEENKKKSDSLVESNNKADVNLLTDDAVCVDIEKNNSDSDKGKTDCSAVESLSSESEILEILEEPNSSSQNSSFKSGLDSSVDCVEINEGGRIIEEAEKDCSLPDTYSNPLKRSIDTVEIENEGLSNLKDNNTMQSLESIVLDGDENKENEKDNKKNVVEDYSEKDVSSKDSIECEIKVGDVQTIFGLEKDSMWTENDLKKTEQDPKDSLEEKNLDDCVDVSVSNEESMHVIESEKEEESQDVDSDGNVMSDAEENVEEDMHIEVEESEAAEELKFEDKDGQMSHLENFSEKKNTNNSEAEENAAHHMKPGSASSRKRGMIESDSEDPYVKKKRLSIDSEEVNTVQSGEENMEDSSRCENLASLDNMDASSKGRDLTENESAATKGTANVEKDPEQLKSSDANENWKTQKQTSEAMFSVLKNFRGTLKSLTRSDLEELIIQKLCEVITERSNVGELRRKAQALEQDQERWKAKAQSLSKQMKEMEMVMKKYICEVQKQIKEGDTQVVTPLKVTRSVGLQVSFYSSANKGQKPALPQPNASSLAQNLNAKNVKGPPPKSPSQFSPVTQNIKSKQLPFQKNSPSLQKSPVCQQRKQIVPKPDYGSSLTNRQQSQQSLLNSTRAVQNQILRPNYKQLSGILPQQQHMQHPLSQQHPQQQQQQQNGSKVIDLTEDDDRHIGNPGKTSGSIRVVNHLTQPPTTQNNRFAYLLPTTSASTGPPVGQSRQVLIATPTMSQPNRQIMCSMPPLLFKGGNVVQSGCQTQMINQSNKVVLPKPVRHPAPLPHRPVNQNTRPSLKLLPPRPALKISKVQTGIVLSWNMSLSPEHAPIASYQLYAYQESDSPPATSLWKKVGDVKALPLPMACTLTQFMAGHKYHFAVRAVDLHSRIGPFSFPGTIVLV